MPQNELHSCPEIVSTSNSKVKEASKLRERKWRARSKTFLVEGKREVVRCVEAGYKLATLFVGPAKFAEFSSDLQDVVRAAIKERLVFSVSDAVLEKISLRQGEGIAAVFHYPDSISEFHLGEKPSIMILDGVEKPGNIGAIIRSCDGAGVDALFISQDGSDYDLYSPHLIRSSVGACFSFPVNILPKEKIYSLIVDTLKVPIYGAVLGKNTVDYRAADYSRGAAICLGSEADGMDEYWKERCRSLQIPMRGISDSLNVSVAAAVLAYESVRHRHTQG